MRKKTLIIIVISLVAVTLISGIVFTSVSLAGNKTGKVPDKEPVTAVSSGSLGIKEDDDVDYTYIPPTLIDITDIPPSPTLEPEEEEIEEPFIPNFTMDLELGSITIFVNKEHALPKNYKPEDLVFVNVYFDLITYDERTMMRAVPAKALEKMFAAAREDGYILSGVSGYRSYERQKKIFTNNIVEKGKDHTLRYSAVPGTSEHQTGLAIDVSSESCDYKLSAEFGKTPEGMWLAENAHRFGYIVRYPKGKYKITGYAYEPWHIRYVGKGLATYLYMNALTLDEYYNYKPSKGFDFETLYADLINYIPPNVTIIPTEGEGVIIGENGEIIDVGGIEDDIPADVDPEEDLSEEEDPNQEDNSDEITPTLPPDQEPDSDNTDPDGDTPKEITPTPSVATPTVTPTVTPTPTPGAEVTVIPQDSVTPTPEATPAP